MIDLIAPEFAAPALVDHAFVVFPHPLAAAGDDAAITPGRRDHHLALAEGLGLGLLAEHVLAVAAGLDHHDRVPMVRRGAMDGVDVGAGQQVAEVVVGLAILGMVLIVDAFARALADLFADVAHGDILHVRVTEERPLVAGTLIADADAAHHDAVAGAGRSPAPMAEPGIRYGQAAAVAAAALRKSRRLARCFMECTSFLEARRNRPRVHDVRNEPIQPGLPKVGRTSIGGQRRAKRRRGDVRIGYNIDGRRADVNFRGAKRRKIMGRVEPATGKAPLSLRERGRG